MSVQNVLNAAIYTTLAAGTALTNLLGGTAIYYLQAPDDAAYPYVVYSYQAGGPQNLTRSDMREAVLFARGYASTPAAAGSIDAQISNLLHHQTLTVSGYTNYWTARETDVSNVEASPTARVYMAGGMYRISLDD